jgi:predicted XRE-type DNA-binding protein
MSSRAAEENTIRSLRLDIALHLARAAIQTGDTQWSAAIRLGIPQPTLSKIVNGRVSDLSIELLLRIAVRARVPITLQTGGDPREAGAFLSGISRESGHLSKSKIAEEARESLRDSERRLAPSERMEAFLEHNQLTIELHRAARAAGQRGHAALGET